MRFHSFADNLVGNVLTVAPQVSTSAHQGHSQMHPYARVASHRRREPSASVTPLGPPMGH